VVYALLERHNIFDAYIASSPMIGWCGDFIFELAEALLGERLSGQIPVRDVRALGSSHVTSFVPEFARIIASHAHDDFRWEFKFEEEWGHAPYASIYDGLNALTDSARKTLVR